MTTIAIRIAVLSAAMAVYMGYAFRGIEYDAMETGPALLGYFLSFTILTIIAVPLYKLKSHPDEKTLTAFAFRFWAVTATIVTIALLVYASTDVASAGKYRDNIIIGGIIMAVMVVALNYALIYASQFLMTKRQRAG